MQTLLLARAALAFRHQATALGKVSSSPAPLRAALPFVAPFSSSSAAASGAMKVGDTLSASLGELATKPLPLDDGSTTTLSAAGQSGKALVLFYVPKAFTPGCSAEACSFRDAYSSFTEAGAVVMSINSDSPKTNAQWKEANRLPFPLATDAGGKLRKAMGVQPTLFVLPGRETFVFDKAGKLLMRFNSQFNVKEHVTRALDALKSAAA